MRHLAFLLEEPSARDALEAIVPTLVPADVQVHFMVFDGKQDLEKRLERKLRHWVLPDTRFIVMRDQDSGVCTRIKQDLAAKCAAAGRPDAIVRIACRELESFFVGDWPAIAQAYGRPQLARQGQRAVFRDPDHLGSPSQELRRHVPDYQKRDGARRIAPLLSEDTNRSRSFRHLVAAIRKSVA